MAAIGGTVGNAQRLNNQKTALSSRLTRMQVASGK
jgi:hypothetical protein